MDTTPPPTASIDPRGLFNGRTFRFDLDSVYGGGPNVSPQLYAADRSHFLVQNPSANGVRDLPRSMGGSAILVLTDTDDIPLVNFGRRIDPLISAPLFMLPIPGAEASGSNVLAYRNLVRGNFYGLPSGQDVASAMGIRPIPPRQFANLGPAFATTTPLWYYILGEAGLMGGNTLGPVGGRIVADVFIKLLEIDRNSILNTSFTPQPPIASTPGNLTVADLLLYAGVAPKPVR